MTFLDVALGIAQTCGIAALWALLGAALATVFRVAINWDQKPDDVTVKQYAAETYVVATCVMQPIALFVALLVEIYR